MYAYMQGTVLGEGPWIVLKSLFLSGDLQYKIMYFMLSHILLMKG